MMYNTQSYWGFERCSSSGILETGKPEGGNESIFPKFVSSLEDGNRPVSQTLCFTLVVSRIQDNGQSSKTQ
jgi:hypothetical protein